MTQERGEGRGEELFEKSLHFRRASSPQPSPPLRAEEREKTSVIGLFRYAKIILIQPEKDVGNDKHFNAGFNRAAG